MFRIQLALFFIIPMIIAIVPIGFARPPFVTHGKSSAASASGDAEPAALLHDREDDPALFLLTADDLDLFGSVVRASNPSPARSPREDSSEVSLNLRPRVDAGPPLDNKLPFDVDLFGSVMRASGPSRAKRLRLDSSNVSLHVRPRVDAGHPFDNELPLDVGPQMDIGPRLVIRPSVVKFDPLPGQCADWPGMQMIRKYMMSFIDHPHSLFKELQRRSWSRKIRHFKDLNAYAEERKLRNGKKVYNIQLTRPTLARPDDPVAINLAHQRLIRWLLYYHAAYLDSLGKKPPFGAHQQQIIDWLVKQFFDTPSSQRVMGEMKLDTQKYGPTQYAIIECFGSDNTPRVEQETACSLIGTWYNSLEKWGPNGDNDFWDKIINAGRVFQKKNLDVDGNPRSRGKLGRKINLLLKT